MILKSKKSADDIRSAPFDLAGPQPKRSSKVGFAIFNFSEQKKWRLTYYALILRHSFIWNEG